MANPPPVFNHIGVRYRTTAAAQSHVLLSASYNRWRLNLNAARKLYCDLGETLTLHDPGFPYRLDAEEVGL